MKRDAIIYVSLVEREYQKGKTLFEMEFKSNQSGVGCRISPSGRSFEDDLPETKCRIENALKSMIRKIFSGRSGQLKIEFSSKPACWGDVSPGYGKGHLFAFYRRTIPIDEAKWSELFFEILQKMNFKEP